MISPVFEPAAIGNPVFAATGFGFGPFPSPCEGQGCIAANLSPARAATRRLWAPCLAEIAPIVGFLLLLCQRSKFHTMHRAR
jgi:hypothetical protein